MDEDEKRRLARKGLDLIDAADPKKIKGRLRESAKDAATDAVAEGVQRFGRWTGDAPEPAEAPQQGVELSGDMSSMIGSSFESFDARLAAAQADPKQRERAALRRELRDVRRSFPEASKELAVLVFACVDLIADLQEGDAGTKGLSPEDLARREQLLERIVALLAPQAAEALSSFVGHVVELSRRARTSIDER